MFWYSKRKSLNVLRILKFCPNVPSQESLESRKRSDNMKICPFFHLIHLFILILSGYSKSRKMICFWNTLREQGFDIIGSVMILMIMIKVKNNNSDDYTVTTFKDHNTHVVSGFNSYFHFISPFPPGWCITVLLLPGPCAKLKSGKW